MIGTQQLKKWALAPTNHTALQVPRALVVSVFAAALDFAVLVLLVEGFGWSPMAAAVVSYLLGGVLQYVLCAWWVFPVAPQSLTIGILAFTILSLVGLGITWATIAVLNELLSVNYVLAKVVALGLAFTWNFLSRKYLLFATRPGSERLDEESAFTADDLERAILPFARLANPPDDVCSTHAAQTDALEDSQV